MLRCSLLYEKLMYFFEISACFHKKHLVVEKNLEIWKNNSNFAHKTSYKDDSQKTVNSKL